MRIDAYKSPYVNKGMERYRSIYSFNTGTEYSCLHNMYRTTLGYVVRYYCEPGVRKIQSLKQLSTYN